MQTHRFARQISACQFYIYLCLLPTKDNALRYSMDYTQIEKHRKTMEFG